MSGEWFDAEAIESERLDADIEQASLMAAGREYARGRKAMLRLLAVGRLDDAARACMHGGGYPLKSLAAENASDPRAGQSGFRCSDCGSVLAGDSLPSRYERPVILFACDRRKA